MTDEDKKRIAEYMNDEGALYNCAFDCNYASLCVAEMQKRGELHSFLMMDTFNQISSWSDFIADLFNAENFFNVMSEWLKERGK